jgi:DNA-directed RNA polymerase subunit N (RpoN/RPB10)
MTGLKRSPMPPRTVPLVTRTPMVRRARTRRGEFGPGVRAALPVRFGGRCVCCGQSLGADWQGQHRRARGNGGSRDPLTASAANALAMTREHHAYAEANPGWALERGYRVPQGTDPATVPVQLWTGQRVLLDHQGGVRPYLTGEAA